MRMIVIIVLKSMAFLAIGESFFSARSAVLKTENGWPPGKADQSAAKDSRR